MWPCRVGLIVPKATSAKWMPKPVTAGSLSSSRMERRARIEPVVEFAFPVLPFGENTELTVTYRNGPPEHPKGTLLPGNSVTVPEEMSFLVSATDRSLALIA